MSRSAICGDWARASRRSRVRWRFLLFSLIGVPPLAGFVGKFSIFSATLSAGYVWLVVIAVVNSVTSAYYYLRPIVSMYADQGGVEVVRMRSRPALIAAIAIAVMGRS